MKIFWTESNRPYIMWGRGTDDFGNVFAIEAIYPGDNLRTIKRLREEYTIVSCDTYEHVTRNASCE